jgi:phosphate transport system permease protein
MTTATSTSVPAAIVHRSLRRQHADVKGRVFEIVLLTSLLISLAVLVVLIGNVVTKSTKVFEAQGLDFLFGDGSLATPQDVAPSDAAIANGATPDYGSIWLGIRGSLTICAVVALVAFPLGIATAVYLEEYAPDNRLTRLININVRNLAGVPSVVYGLLGASLFVGTLGGITGKNTVLSAGLTLAVLVLPIVIITSAEAIRAVPNALREAGYGVGASKWNVIRSLVLPTAAPGILTGTVLSIARAVGEAAPILIVGVVTLKYTTGNLSFIDGLTADNKFTALPGLIAGYAKQSQRDFQNMTAATIVVLLGITLVMNAAAIVLRNRFEKS